MVALNAWYGDELISLRGADDLDLLLDRMSREHAAAPAPPLLQISRRERGSWAILHIGLNHNRGVVGHTDKSGAVISTDGTAPTGRELTYDHRGEPHPMPSNAEVPAANVRQAAHDFLRADGARPTCVQWQVTVSPAD
ncbi:MAG: Imm1 family immunity protein [Umezawaea sp.]|jgi:hypothetical protein